jgi:hypothetical protein
VVGLAPRVAVAVVQEGILKAPMRVLQPKDDVAA